MWKELVNYFTRPFLEEKKKGGVQKSGGSPKVIKGSPKVNFGRPKAYRNRVRFQFYTEKKTLEEFKKTCNIKSLYPNRVLTAYMENFNSQEAAVKDKIKVAEMVLKTRR